MATIETLVLAAEAGASEKTLLRSPTTIDASPARAAILDAIMCSYSFLYR
jgi:hypothetical protein